MAPKTRTQTGKLPAKPLLLSQPAEVEKEELLEELIQEDDDALDLVSDDDEQALVAPMDPKNFVSEAFETFESKQYLRDGLCVIRHLGGRKYELVNLQHVDNDVMGSEEVGAYIRSDPERLGTLEGVRETWNTSRLNFVQATNSASK